MRRPAGLAMLVLALAAGGCADDGVGGTTVDESAADATIGVLGLPPVRTTIVVESAPAPAADSSAPSSAVATTIAPAATTTTTTTGRATTTVPIVTTSQASQAVAPVEVPPCRLDLIVDQTQTLYEGITPSDLSCAQEWAAWIGRPQDELGDGFFAVAQWTGSSWELLNLGTADVCAGAGVPAELWTELGCFE